MILMMHLLFTVLKLLHIEIHSETDSYWFLLAADFENKETFACFKLADLLTWEPCDNKITCRSCLLLPRGSIFLISFIVIKSQSWQYSCKRLLLFTSPVLGEVSLITFVCLWVDFSEYFLCNREKLSFNIKWIPPPSSAIAHTNKQFCRGFFMSLHNLFESPELLVHKWANESWEALADRTLTLSISLSTPDLHSLRHTPGRLVKNILEMQTFIPFASYQYGLSQPKCCDVRRFGAPMRSLSKCPRVCMFCIWTNWAQWVSKCRQS